MVFDESIRFYGTFRPYQQRALNNLEKYLDNDKIHIVAAPGSGKTILGLELIRKINNPTLVLVPSITIREQWINRFREYFVNKDMDYKDYISSSILEYKPIMCITYQALYCAYKKLVNNETEEGLNDHENYDSFDLFETLLRYNVKTICLDECHHLKSEWWKALETTISMLENIKLIALTATPPYDSMNSEWTKYANLCGPIDDEIFVTELIKDKNICYHQDYIYYSYPTEEETNEIINRYSIALKFFHKYKNNLELVNVVKKSNLVNNEKKFFEGFYLTPKYYQSIVLFLKENNVVIKPKILATVKKLKLDKRYFEILLQNVLFDDSSSYPSSQFLTSLKKEIAALGLSSHRDLLITHDERTDKTLTSSLSKLHSIYEIVKYERSSLKDNLRCLILTDYIKISSLHDKIDSFGSVPIFNYLNNENINGVRLCLLTGSICIIPNDIKDKLLEIDKSFSFNKVNENYLELVISQTNRKKVVNSLTNMFTLGYFNVIIGTKALLGEGWDSPCINSLILASNIGSYVSSNQTRGRAIRIDRTNLDKISKIWHLVTVNPIDATRNEDFNIIDRRFDSFVGISFDGKRVENGLERLNIKRVPITKKEVSIENNKTMIEAINHNKVKIGWDNCIKNAKEIEMLHRVTYVEKKRIRYTLSFYLSFILSGIYAFLIYFIFNGYYQYFLNLKFGWIFLVTTLVFCIGFGIRNALIVLRQIGPLLKAKFMGNALLKSLKKVKAIESSNVKVRTIEAKDKVGIYLKNASIYEQNMFSIALLEMLGNIDQPRYMICRFNKMLSSEFYVVPFVLKKNRESVEIFRREMSIRFGYFDFIFAKNDSNRHFALKARFIYENIINSTKMYSKLMLLQTKKKK